MVRYLFYKMYPYEVFSLNQPIEQCCVRIINLPCVNFLIDLSYSLDLLVHKK